MAGERCRAPADTVCPIQNKALHTVLYSLVPINTPPPTPTTNVKSSWKVSSTHWEAWVVTQLGGWIQRRRLVMFGQTNINQIVVMIPTRRRQRYV